MSAFGTTVFHGGVVAGRMADLERHDVPDAVDPEGWTLTVDGCVDRPRSFTPDDLGAMELVATTGDFSCVEGWTATDLQWRGVPVETVLDRAAPDPDAAFVLAHAMDGEYACGFPLEDLDGALLALELDGEPLPVEHGGPARLVPATADSDCWESVKWVVRVELLADEPEDTARDLALSRLG